MARSVVITAGNTDERIERVRAALYWRGGDAESDLDSLERELTELREELAEATQEFEEYRGTVQGIHVRLTAAREVVEALRTDVADHLDGCECYKCAALSHYDEVTR